MIPGNQSAITQEAPIQLPVPMSKAGETAYKKFVFMQDAHKLMSDSVRKKKEAKTILDEARMEDEDWRKVQQDKKALLQDIADIRKRENQVLDRLNVDLESELTTLIDIKKEEGDNKQIFDQASLECAKDPIQMSLVIFDDFGMVGNAVSGFKAIVKKQRKPRKKDRQTALNKSDFIKDTFQIKK